MKTGFSTEPRGRPARRRLRVPLEAAPHELLFGEVAVRGKVRRHHACSSAIGALPPDRSSSSRKTGAETLLINGSWLSHMTATAARRGGVRGGGPSSKSGRNIEEGSPCQHDALCRPSVLSETCVSAPTLMSVTLLERTSPMKHSIAATGPAFAMPADASLDAQGLQPTGATRARSRAFLAAAEEAPHPAPRLHHACRASSPLPSHRCSRLRRHAAMPSSLPPATLLLTPSHVPASCQPPATSHQPWATTHPATSHLATRSAGLLVGLGGCRAGHAGAGRPGAAAGGIP